MAEKWSGDGRFYLPARQIEPYRLWFEFLKLAHVDPDVAVDYDFYADWGPFWDMSFNDWWSGERWQTLFAVDAGVRVVSGRDTIQSDSQAIVVRLPLNKDPSDTLKEVQTLLQQHKAGIRFDQIDQGRFGLSVGYEKGFLKYLDRANFMLRLYGLWLKNADLDKKVRVGRTALEFYDWAKGRDDLIRKRGYRYRRPMFPGAVRTFAEGVKAGESISVHDERRAFTRYLAKAKMLVTNAGAGTFPGRW
jgi:hypothetical protein